MTVEKILRCICTVDYEDPKDDEGMPHLAPRNGLDPHKQFWSIWCPECGRGSKLVEFRSPYLALKDWNEMQEELHREHDDPAYPFFIEEGDNEDDLF